MKSTDPNDKRLYSTISVELHCADCKTAGVPIDECNRRGHTKLMSVPWKSARNTAQVQSLMPQAELMKSEVFGVSRGRETLLSAALVDQFVSSQNIRQIAARSLDEALTWIDPSGGGSQSNLVLVTMAMMPTNRHFAILGISTDPNKTFVAGEKACDDHFSALRHRMPALDRQATLLQAAERNYGGNFTAGRLMAFADRYPPTLNLSDKAMEVGVFTSQYTKEESVLMGCDALEQAHVFWADGWVSNVPSHKRAGLMQETGAQLKRFRKQIKGKSRGGNSYEYTGKEGANGQDDIAFGIFSAIFWLRKWHAKAEHEKFLRTRAAQMQFANNLAR